MHMRVQADACRPRKSRLQVWKHIARTRTSKDPHNLSIRVPWLGFLVRHRIFPHKFCRNMKLVELFAQRLVIFTHFLDLCKLDLSMQTEEF